MSEKILNQGEQFGFFSKKPVLISAQDIRYDEVRRKPDDVMDKIKLVLEKLDKLKAKRIVIDSVSSMEIENGIQARIAARKIIEGLNKIGATSIITGEAMNGEYPDEVTPFLVDGVVILKKQAVGPEETRSVIVAKMRETNISGGVHSLEFTKQGLKAD